MIRGANYTMIKKYITRSPDGFALNCDDKVYPSMKQAKEAIKNWVKNYTAQGYYSQTCYNGYVRHISLAELSDYCDIVAI